MNYQHRFLNGDVSDLAPGKLVCVGKNYRADENDPVIPPRDVPVLFMKPPGALVSLEHQIRMPDYTPCYYEVELAALIGSELHNASAAEATGAIVGFAVALDLTLKEELDNLKQAGRPWELAKSFDYSCPISPFVRPDQIKDPQNTVIQLSVNDEVKQEASTNLMIIEPFELVSIMSKYFTLFPGDVVLTGTPVGSDVLPPGASLMLRLDDQFQFQAGVR